MEYNSEAIIVCDGNAFEAIFLYLHQRLEVYIGAQYARNKVILVELLQRKNVRVNTLACA